MPRHLIQTDVPSITAAASAGFNSLRSGSGAPAGGVGQDGDWYIDVITSSLYGPKAAGVWPGSFVSLGGGGGTAQNAPVYVYYDATNQVYPNRPSTSAPAWWVGPATPATGGVAAINNRDFWIKTI